MPLARRHGARSPPRATPQNEPDRWRRRWRARTSPGSPALIWSTTFVWFVYETRSPAERLLHHDRSTARRTAGRSPSRGGCSRSFWSFAFLPAMRTAGSPPGTTMKITKTRKLTANSTSTIPMQAADDEGEHHQCSSISHLGARVERVTQAVAEDVQRDHGEDDREAGDDRQPRRGRDARPGPPRSAFPHDGCGGWTPAPRNDSAASSEDVVRDDQREEDERRRRDVREDLREHDRGGSTRPARSPPRRTPSRAATGSARAAAGRRTGSARTRSRASGSRGCPPLMLIGPKWWKPLIDSAEPSAIASRITGNAQIRSKKREMTQSVEPP